MIEIPILNHLMGMSKVERMLLRSKPGWALAALSLSTLGRISKTFYDPSSVIQEHPELSTETSRIIGMTQYEMVASK